MDLDTSLIEFKQAIDYFFDNNFDEAKKLMEPWARSSMYHALGNSIFAFFEAILTFEPEYMEKASDALKQGLEVCSKQRKISSLSQSFAKMVWKTDYNAYTLEEIHAELCYAESLLLKSMFSLMNDESMVNFVKAGFNIKACFQTYKGCASILENRKWENETHRAHLDSGVKMGLGSFNLMISLLPGRTIKLLEFIGFSGDKDYGLAELRSGVIGREGVRQVLCVMNLLCYHLIIVPVIKDTDENLDWCEKALREELSFHPLGIWFSFLKGRLEFSKGNLKDSADWYIKSLKSQDQMPQFHYLCYWELVRAHGLQQQWDKSLEFAKLMVEGANWSKTIYTYQQAAIMIMTKPSSEDEERVTIDTLMKQVPTFKQRIAGKSIPFEKFVIKKAKRYFEQKNNLVLPMYELMYVWNLFKVAGKQEDVVKRIFHNIEEEEKHLKSAPKTDFQEDNEALILLLKGACLRQMKHYSQADDCLEKVLESNKHIKDDTYLVPFATVELALSQRDQGNIEAAISFLEDAKKKYTRYSLESRLHFRIHTELADLRKRLSGMDLAKTDTSEQCENESNKFI